MANLSEILQMSNSQILSNILYPIEYSSGYTEVPTGYPTLSIAYLIHSTSQYSYWRSRTSCSYIYTRYIPGILYPGIRFVDPQSVDQQGSDICDRQLSTFNDIIFNLLLISLAKVRIKEPASKSFNNTTAVDCRQYKKPYNNKKSKAIHFGRERRHREG